MAAKNKLTKFAENKTFPHFFEPQLNYFQSVDFELKGNWNADFFKNDNPITVELGCGNGDYTVGLAKMHPKRNFIGVDIKGARMWNGAVASLKAQLSNVAFVRTRVEFTTQCFAQNEVAEIWLTFPDPQLGQPKRIKQRLSSSRFLTYYQHFLVDNGIVNLKTDDETLFDYTLNLLKVNELDILCEAADLYNSNAYCDELTITTRYEQMWREKGRIIKYLKFRLPRDKELREP